MHLGSPAGGRRYAASPDHWSVRIEALRRLLVAWLARTDVPTVDAGAFSADRAMPPGVRLAGRFLGHLIDPTVPLNEPADCEEAAKALEAVVWAIGLELETPEVANRLLVAAEAAETAADTVAVAEAMWSAFCPDAVGLLGDWPAAVAEVRSRRLLREITPNPFPIAPDGVLLATNVLLTRPLGAGDGLPPDEAAAASRAESESQVAWYDHPIPIDSTAEHHEVVYGLRALDDAVSFDRERGVLDGTVPVVLSVSTTHESLDDIASVHLQRVLADVALSNLELHVFTEQAANRLVSDALGPAIDHMGGSRSSAERVFGVAGPYGRHYSFLKAIAAVWSVLFDDRIRGTFKFDLDQVFAQQQLVNETGASAFEHIAADGWGGLATDSAGRTVALDFMAGTLVNASDAGRGLHTPDVVHPGEPRRSEDFIFYGSLPQAVSTEAEMMPGPEWRQRVHLTGGTTGATVAGLRRERPFSPSFWGRAEDQAYGLSVWSQVPRPVSLHVPGLVMRHDKHVFAADAIAAAATDKLIGDHERILMFSSLVGVLDADLESVKTELAPFTGAFVSNMPVTLTFVRLAVTALSWANDRADEAHRLFVEGVRRCDASRRFASEKLADELRADRQGWADIYDALDLLEGKIQTGEEWAMTARTAAREVLESTRIRTA